MKDSLIRGLRWSEKYTKTDMVYLVKNSGWVFFGQVITSLSALIVMIALANLVDKGEYGEYRYIISMILILSICTLPGMNTALVRTTAQGNSGQLKSTVKIRMKWGLLGSLLAFILSGYYWLNFNNSLATSFMVVGVFLPLYNTFFGYYFFLQGKKLFNQSAIVQGIGRIFFLVAMLLTAYLIPQASYLIGVYMFTTFLMQYGGYYWTNKKHEEQPQDSTETLSYGRYLSVWQFPYLVSSQIGIITTWYWLGDVEAAIYAIAMMVPMEMNRFGTILNQVAMPKMTNRDFDIKSLFGKIIKLQILLVFVWMMYALCASTLFSLFFPKYPEAVIYSIFAMLMIVFIPRILFHGLIHARGMKNVIQKTSILICVTHILLTIILIPTYGLWGAVAAQIIGSGFDFICLGYILRRHS